MRQTAYEKWIQNEGIPIYAGYGIADVRQLQRQPWARTGGLGAFIQLQGMEGYTGMYVGEIPPGEALLPQHHLYEELVCIVQGCGATVIWTDDKPEDRHMFEWQQYSLFAPPLNTHWQMYNTSQEPVVYLSVTSAPLVMDLLHDLNFIFDNSYVFPGRFDGRADFFKVGDRFEGDLGWVWDTNFIPDLANALVDPQERKGAGVRITTFEMADNSLVGHMADWPRGRYHKAHHHGGGAILLILRSEGYTLMWPVDAGRRPYEEGNADAVVRVNWGPGAVLSPPTRWYHQHFNTGPEAARQIAFRFGSVKHDTGFRKAGRLKGIYVSEREGGTLIEYEHEDPRIREDFEREVAAKGLRHDMPVWAYR